LNNIGNTVRNIGASYFASLNPGFGIGLSGNGPACPGCAAADFLRNTPFFGINNPNPFYQAEAIYVDHGWSLVGQEGDRGHFLF